ncbi:MAG: hypothetical protein ACRELA_21360 [Candidatus Rokuibacteriota bacterium]
MLFPMLTARAFFRDPVAYIQAHGSDNPLVRLAAGLSRFVVVRDPEQIWRVLVTDASSFRPGKWKRRARRFLGDALNTLDGEEHRRRRRLLQPSVDRRRIAALTSAIVSRVDRAQARWSDGGRLWLRDEIDRLVLTVAGDVLLSTDLEPQASRLARALCEIMAGVPRFTPRVPGTRQSRALAEVGRFVSALMLEAPLCGALGDRLERGARRVALARLRAHYGSFGRGVPAEVMAS